MNTEQMAEVKGYLCGFICSGAQSEGRLWLDSLEGGLQLFDLDESSQRSELIELYKQVSVNFVEENLGLSQMIFEKSLSINSRAYIFKKWCQGFVSGMQLSGLSPKQLSHADHLMEKIQYFKGFSELETDNIEVSDADEMMFTQVTHLLEETVLQIYRILNQGKPKH